MMKQIRLPHFPIAAAALAVWLPLAALAGIPIQQWTQPSGARVYLIESPAIPMVDVQIDFDAGGRRDPPGQAGLAQATASMASRGLRASADDSDAALDENALSDAWADLGAAFGGSAGSDRMSFSLRSLSDPPLLSRVAALAARQLGEPAYPADVWARERERMRASIRESRTRPATVAGRAYASAVYGAHPYGAEVTEDSLMRITVADMQRAHDSGLLACRAKVSVVGAVTRAQADALATRILARLPKALAGAACPPQSPVPEVEALTRAVDERISFASAQAQVLLGQPGIRRTDPDYLALTVGNYILGGGGFVSRLTEEVRQKRGLSYGVYSGFSPGLHAGAFTVSLQTRPDQAQQALEVAREVLARFVREGPTEAELAAAKANLVGGFALRLDSNSKLLANLVGIAWNGLPLDYLDTWSAQVQRLTVADIRAAFARALQPERMVSVVLGPAGALR